MDPSAEWVRLTTRGPISEAEPLTVQWVERAGGGSFRNIPTSLFKGWDGYALELLGRTADRFPVDNEPWPWWRFDNFVLETWLQLAYIPGSPLGARVVWTPHTDVAKSIEVLRDDWSDDDLKDAARGLKLLHGATGAGRPFGSREDDPEPDFPNWYAETYWRLFDLHRKRPSQIEIASDRGISPDTLARRRDQYRVPRVPPKPAEDNN
jgi:hypothetical protein